MSNIKIEFPADDLRAARSMGLALLSIGQPECVLSIAWPDGAETYNPPAGNPDRIEPDVTVTVDPSLTFTISEEDNTGAPLVPAPAGDASRVDTKGVPHNAEWCIGGNPKQPFNQSGPRAGQWKKRRGVGEAEYDAWYAGALAAVAPAPAANEAGQVDTAGAFAAEGATVVPIASAATAVHFEDFPEFITWASEQQNAGNLLQADIDEAYAAVGVVVTDLFPPATPDVIVERLGKLHAYLSQKVGQ